MKPTLFYARSGNSLRAVIAAKYFPSEVEYQYVDITKQEQKQPAFLALSPSGKVPLFVTPEGKVVSQSGAIAELLTQNTTLTMNSETDEILLKQLCYNAVSDIAVTNAHARYLSNNESASTLLMARLANSFDTSFTPLKDSLFLMGNKISLADVFHFPVPHMRSRMIQANAEWSHIENWIDRCLQVDEFKEAVDMAGVIL